MKEISNDFRITWKTFSSIKLELKLLIEQTSSDKSREWNLLVYFIIYL